MQQRVWEGIAKSWNRHRKEPEAPVLDFMKNKKFLLDIGCGSGRHFVSGKKYIGIDFSKEMLKLAKQNVRRKKIKVHLICADASALPLKDSMFKDVMLSSVLHVLEGKKKILCLKEIKRIIKNGGSAIITVWYRCQPRFVGKGNAVYVPWRVGKKKYMRYYYLFTKDELKNLLDEHFEVQYIESQKRSKSYDENIIVVVKKL